MTGLTARQEKFVEHYALCGNAAEAARLAGYSPKSARVTGPETLSNPAVKQALEARRQAFRAELEVTRQDVVNGLLEAILMARSQLNPGAMIQGCVQLAKLLGFYEPEHVSLTVNADSEMLKAKYAAMSDDELIALISASNSSFASSSI